MVGHVPDRPGQPLWRSPPKTPVKQRQRNEDNVHATTPSNTAGGSPTTTHKKEISKHRQQWAAPKTPPGYWDISFPDTQQVAEINRKAAEMEAEKEQTVEEQAKWVSFLRPEI